jgi:hypothetical protein
MRKPRPGRVVWLHVHYLTDPRRRVWAVETQGRYLTAQAVKVRIPMETVFRGQHSRQPKAYLKGKGIVKRRGAVLEIYGNCESRS